MCASWLSRYVGHKSIRVKQHRSHRPKSLANRGGYVQACRGGFSRSGASSQACFGLIGVWSAALLGSYASTKLAFLETLDCDCELDGSASNVQSRNQTSCVVRIRLLDIRLVHGQYCAVQSTHTCQHRLQDQVVRTHSSTVSASCIACCC